MAELASVRYIVDDVQAALDFYTSVLGFEAGVTALPAFAEVTRGPLRVLLSGPKSSGGRPLPNGDVPQPGGWNRIHLVVDDIANEIERLAERGVRFRSEIVSGPGGQQVVFDDPAGNPIELFEPAH
jgi:catechol 2,3-dioxygenase-like lactoylglutathione lyase family enzyme